MEAHLRGIRISPKKANIVAGIVRGKNAAEALNMLRFTPKKAARLLQKTLQSAVANAEHNDNVSAEDLMISEIIINKGPVMKRFLPSTRGRALPLAKPTSHISIYLKRK